jgi:hypothetical protein
VREDESRVLQTPWPDSAAIDANFYPHLDADTETDFVSHAQSISAAQCSTISRTFTEADDHISNFDADNESDSDTNIGTDVFPDSGADVDSHFQTNIVANTFTHSFTNFDTDALPDFDADVDSHFNTNIVANSFPHSVPNIESYSVTNIGTVVFPDSDADVDSHFETNIVANFHTDVLPDSDADVESHFESLILADFDSNRQPNRASDGQSHAYTNIGADDVTNYSSKFAANSSAHDSFADSPADQVSNDLRDRLHRPGEWRGNPLCFVALHLPEHYRAERWS